MKRTFLILSALSIIVLTGFFYSESRAFFGWFSKKVENYVLDVPVRESSEELRFAFVSDMNIYPVPTRLENFPAPPISNSGILYTESQVLFQEFIRDVVDNRDKLSLDFVLFGGSQVANNIHWRLFEDIADELTKTGHDYYYLLGDGEYRGPVAINEITREPYWHKKFKGVNFIAIDNAWGKINAVETEWLNDKVAELVKSREEVYFFSYRPLDVKTRLLVERMPGLKLLTNSYELKMTRFNAGKGSRNINESEYLYKPYTYLSNPALSVYPCYFTMIIRKPNGELFIQEIETKLKGVAREGRKQLKDLGKDPDDYLESVRIDSAVLRYPIK